MHMPQLDGLRAFAVLGVTYTSNIYFARRGDLNIAGSHFWTLAVEEQFYLMWPWILICTPRRYDLKRFFTCTPQTPGPEPQLAGAVAR